MLPFPPQKTQEFGTAANPLKMLGSLIRIYDQYVLAKVWYKILAIVVIIKTILKIYCFF